MKGRLHYIDVTKGLLIILVVFHHVINVANGLGFASESLLKWQSTYILYNCFFMQCFFVLTGMVSNFDKPFCPYLNSNVKCLLCPFVFFCVFEAIFRSFYYGWNALYFNQGGVHVIFLLEGFWFLSALFIAKILYYFIRFITASSIVRFLLCMVPLFISVTLDNLLGSDYYNWFHYRNAMVMVPFLCLGEFMKNFFTKENKKYIFPISAVYLLTIVSFKLFGWPELTPYTHLAFFDFTWTDIPRYLIIATTGSVFMISIGWIIGQNKILEKFGKLSLLIYGFHLSLLMMIETLFAKIWVPQTMVSSLVWYIIIAIVALVLSTLLGHYFIKSKLRILVGKPL